MRFPVPEWLSVRAVQDRGQRKSWVLPAARSRVACGAMRRRKANRSAAVVELRHRRIAAPPVVPAWQRRARALGLKQRTIAALLGASEGWVSIAIRRARPPDRIAAVIAAWSLMTPSQRGEWLYETGLGRLVLRQRIVTPGEDQEAQWPGLAAQKSRKLSPTIRPSPQFASRSRRSLTAG